MAIKEATNKEAAIVETLKLQFAKTLPIQVIASSVKLALLLMEIKILEKQEMEDKALVTTTNSNIHTNNLHLWDKAKAMEAQAVKLSLLSHSDFRKRYSKPWSK